MDNIHLKNKKIICSVTNDLFRDRRMIRICDALQEFGAEVTLIGVKKPDSLVLKKQDFKQIRFKMLFNKGVLFYIEYNIRLFIHLMFHTFDIANPVDTDTVLAVFFAARIKRKKIVFDAHEYFTGVPELQNRRLKKSIWNFIEKMILTKIKVNYTVSGSLKKLYENKTGQKYYVIKNYPLKSRFKNIEIPDINLKRDIIISYVGALNEGRGLKSALKMMTFLNSRYKLLLIGGGDLEDELKAMSKALNLNKRVKFTGWVDPDIIPGLLTKSHVGLNLLDINSTNYRVSLANKIFDYMHLGIPCLTMNFDEYKIINNKYNCFILTETLEPEINCKLVENLVLNKNRYNDLRQNSLEASQYMIWEKEKEKLITVFSQL